MNKPELLDEVKLGGRPVGEVRQALLAKAAELTTPTRAPTLRELAAAACVGLKAAQRTICNLKRAQLLCCPRTRRVPYRSKPVAEWAPAALVLADAEALDAVPNFSFDALSRAW